MENTTENNVEKIVKSFRDADFECARIDDSCRFYIIIPTFKQKQVEKSKNKHTPFNGSAYWSYIVFTTTSRTIKALYCIPKTYAGDGYIGMRSSSHTQSEGLICHNGSLSFDYYLQSEEVKYKDGQNQSIDVYSIISKCVQSVNLEIVGQQHYVNSLALKNTPKHINVNAENYDGLLMQDCFSQPSSENILYNLVREAFLECTDRKNFIYLTILKHIEEDEDFKLSFVYNGKPYSVQRKLVRQREDTFRCTATHPFIRKMFLRLDDDLYGLENMKYVKYNELLEQGAELVYKIYMPDDDPADFLFLPVDPIKINLEHKNDDTNNISIEEFFKNL